MPDTPDKVPDKPKPGTDKPGMGAPGAGATSLNLVLTTDRG